MGWVGSGEIFRGLSWVRSEKFRIGFGFKNGPTSSPTLWSARRREVNYRDT